MVQHGRWLAGHCPGARSGRVQHVRLAPNSTAIAFNSARRRAPPSGGGRHCCAARAASSGDDLRRPTHCLTSLKGDPGWVAGRPWVPVQWTVATRPPPPVSASRFLNCSARVPLVAWLSAGCAANAAAKPAAAQSSLLCTRSGLARRTPASPGARSHTRRLASHPCVPPRRPGTASSALVPSPLCVGEAAGLTAALR